MILKISAGTIARLYPLVEGLVKHAAIHQDI